ncbi:MAG: putative inorganic carbon transporter subunit DabA, partial [Bacteroidota bacterium]
MTKHIAFDEDHVLHELKHYLPSQNPLKDFIHHNSLHAFQHLDFFEGIFKASSLFGFKVTLSLNEFRKLYKVGRIRTEILTRTLKEKFGETDFSYWLDKVLHESYDSNKVAAIGQFRKNWQRFYQID